MARKRGVAGGPGEGGRGGGALAPNPRKTGGGLLLPREHERGCQATILDQRQRDCLIDLIRKGMGRINAAYHMKIAPKVVRRTQEFCPDFAQDVQDAEESRDERCETVLFVKGLEERDVPAIRVLLDRRTKAAELLLRREELQKIRDVESLRSLVMELVAIVFEEVKDEAQRQSILGKVTTRLARLGPAEDRAEG